MRQKKQKWDNNEAKYIFQIPDNQLIINTRHSCLTCLTVFLKTVEGKNGIESKKSVITETSVTDYFQPIEFQSFIKIQTVSLRSQNTGFCHNIEIPIKSKFMYVLGIDKRISDGKFPLVLFHHYLINV